MGTDSVSPRDFAALEKRVSALESSHTREIDQLNRIFVKAKDFDDRLDKKISDFETRLRRDMKGLATEKDFREQIDKQVLGKLSEVEKTANTAETRLKTVDTTLSKVNTAIESAKSQDEKLEKMITDLRAKIDRLARGS
jgi:chromosome segregation ATPase